MPDCTKCKHLEEEHDGVCTHYFQTCDCDGFELEEGFDDPSPNSGAAGNPDPASAMVAPTLGASIYKAMFP